MDHACDSAMIVEDVDVTVVSLATRTLHHIQYHNLRNTPLHRHCSLPVRGPAGGNARRCVVCEEIYPFIETGPRNNKCNRCTKRNTFAKSNNLSPEEAPPCLKELNQIEKAAISQICPIIQVFTKGSSKATRGHCVCVMQDIKSFAMKLPPHP